MFPVDQQRNVVKNLAEMQLSVNNNYEAVHLKLGTGQDRKLMIGICDGFRSVDHVHNRINYLKCESLPIRFHCQNTQPLRTPPGLWRQNDGISGKI